MNGQAFRPGLLVKLKAPTEPEDHGREQRPLVPIAKRPVKGLAPTHGMVKRSGRVIDLRREKQPEDCCDQENLRSGVPLARFLTRLGVVDVICSRTDHALSLNSAASGVKSPLRPVSDEQVLAKSGGVAVGHLPGPGPSLSSVLASHCTAIIP